MEQYFSTSTEQQHKAQSSVPSFPFFLSDNCFFFPTVGTDPGRLQLWSQELIFFLRSILSLTSALRKNPTNTAGKETSGGLCAHHKWCLGGLLVPSEGGELSCC